MPEQEDVFVAPGLRSPFARMDRELSSRTALELSVPVVQQTVVGPPSFGPAGGPAEVDLALWGAVVPDLGVSNWAREVWLEAGLDRATPAQTVIQACGTSLAAATHAAGQVARGAADLALCGGVEGMSQVQVGLSRELSRTVRRLGTARGPGDALSTLASVRPSDFGLHVPRVAERTTGMTMGEHAELMARDWEVSRDEQDAYALESHRKAARADEDGFFRDLLVSPGTFSADRDRVIRPDTSREKLASLSPAFDRDRGTLTAGNSTPLTDGASACWVGSAAGVGQLPDGVPRARLLDWEQAGVDPERDGLLMAPALALPRMLSRHGLRYEDVDLWEIHEAFAAQVLCTYRALESESWLSERARVEPELGDFPRERVNPNGGSLALGHPFAATGARILSQAVKELAGRPSGTRAVVSICAAGGLGHVALLEAV